MLKVKTDEGSISVSGRGDLSLRSNNVLLAQFTPVMKKSERKKR